jgi:uncharacterized membrane protein
MLSDDSKAAIVARVRGLERATGVEVVTAVVPRAHPYPEAVWSAFALAAAFAGFAAVALDALDPTWPGAHDVLAAVVAVLGAGVASAVGAMLVPAYARCFLRAPHAEAEVRRAARLLFHDHGLARTPQRLGVLVLVACFERRVEIVADTGFDGRVVAADWHAVVDAATRAMRGGDAAGALLAALDRLDAVLQGRGYVGTPHDNALPDAPLELASP